jgi:hypothetical protein
MRRARALSEGAFAPSGGRRGADEGVRELRRGAEVRVEVRREDTLVEPRRGTVE